MVKPLTNPLRDRRPPLGNLMAAAARRLAVELQAGLRAAGFEDLSPAHAPVFQAVEPDGSSITELARYAGMTKQAMGELARGLESRGYVEIVPSAQDRRVRAVRLTDRGWAAARAGEGIVAEFDARLDEAIGAPEVAALRASLEQIAAGVGSHHSADVEVGTAVMR